MKAKNMALCALFAALLCLCAWLAIPFGSGTLTLQTFGVFLTLGLLGGKRGSLTVGLYLLLGAVGLPVFSGFRSGAGALLDATGGFLLGFLMMSLIYWLTTVLFGTRPAVRLIALVLGQLVCYTVGTVWFSCVYVDGGSFWAAISVCVLPYLIPDGIKLVLAWILTAKLKRFV